MDVFSVEQDIPASSGPTTIDGVDFQSDTGGSDTPASVNADIPASVSAAIASSGPPTVDGGNAYAKKLFVGRMHFQTSEKELREHFGQYGEIEHIKITIDPTTGRSRGFAFIMFKSVESLSSAEAAGDHIINCEKVKPKKTKGRQGKLFVGGLTTELTDDDIKPHFAHFGTIADDHIINGKKVCPKKAMGRQGKNFVGGLTAELTDDDTKSHFAQFGTIVDTQCFDVRLFYRPYLSYTQGLH
ncbi:RNA-binding protein squid-like [Leptinotarsa decemlineata]|uniref:RNA-binding protein squid-like n=1 Tax=Leptinotarsa decemlineata TaxID=7539 RepID=UPI003D3099DC